ncbi:MAG: ATP-binding protein, partial [Acidobacteriota bacterium]
VMPIAFVLTDATHRTTYWNPAAERIFGFTKEEILGTYGHNLLVPLESHRYVEEVFKRIAAGESLSSSVSENLTKDGRRITCEWHTAPLRRADGTLLGIMSMAQDITERKRAEQSLQEANQRAFRDYEQLVERIATLGQTLGNARELTSIFRALCEFAVASAPCDGLVISLYEPEKKTRRIVYCWTDQTEFDAQDVMDIPVKDGMAGRSITSGLVVIENDFQQELRTRNPKPIQVGELDGDQVPRAALSAPMTIMGRTVGCVEIQSYQAGAYQQEHATAMRMAANLAANAVENVTLMEREQAKGEQLRQSQKMEAIGHLAGGVAHDFNNLLTAITGYSDLALRRVDLSEPLRKNIEHIRKAGLRAAALTSQLLAFSRKQVMQARIIDLNVIVTDMDNLLCRLIGEDIDLVTLLKPELGQVKADPGQIEQVILNLVVNARDAMPRGGKITIETNQIYIDKTYAGTHVAMNPGHYIKLSVSDTGVGMDAETQKLIFDPFFTTKEVGRGTGLGLSTVYGIVKQSGGNIWVYSEPNHGTTFKIYLPRVDRVSKKDEPGEVALAPRGRETVLIVEDEEMVRNLAHEILIDHGYNVMLASNGVEGLRVSKAFDGSIDLMITDVVMPEMSGRELAENIALLRPETKVLYMSGYTDDAIVRHGVLEESKSFIQKPFLPDLLLRKMREVLDQLAPAGK